jgi:AcrR family transcriptional regulator
MASPDGQSNRPSGSGAARGAASTVTRERLMKAAAELIAELGWGRVTTRAVAQRAGLPHGSVSYHFRGKQELLRDSALHAFQQAVPVDQFAALDTVDALIDLIAAEVAGPEGVDPMISQLMLEAMREADRDAELRERMGAMLGEYRRVMVATMRAEQQRGQAFDGAPPEALATVLAAVGDGLLLHVLLDPELDVAGSVDALRSLLAPRPSQEP